jgi:signal transduction histidine kinase
MRQGQGNRSLQDPRIPIVAIAASGSVTKVNGAARKLLDSTEAPSGGLNLGALLAGFFVRHHRSGGIVSLSLSAEPAEPDEALSIVLSEEPADGAAQAGAAEPQGGQPALYDGDHRLSDFIAHELRNPMSAIQGMARVLRVRHDSIPEADKVATVHSIEIEAQRALLILEGLLNLAQRRFQSEHESQIPLHAVVHRVVTAHRRHNPERVMVISGDSPIFVRANSIALELALGNLLSNAEKYAPRNTQISVAAHQEGSRASIIVIDEGAALPPKRYQSLWDIYAKGPDQDTVVSGSGIGLALCKELIESMDGRVWAGPRSSGGSIFVITLPAVADVSLPTSLGTRISTLTPAGVIAV